MAECKNCIKKDVCDRDVGHGYSVCPHYLSSDVVEVVRCKDCIYRDPEDKKCDCSFQAKSGMFPMDDNDFCSYGERRKEDDEIY